MDPVTSVGTGPRLALDTVTTELTDLLHRLDERAFAALVEEFADEQRRWFFTGQGRSGLAARMAAMRFMHLGRRSHVLGEATAPSVRDGDGLVVISGSGVTPVSAGFARIARSEGARVVLLSSRPDSVLAELADVVFPIPAGGSKQLGGSLFEQASLLVMDAVVFALAQHMQDAPGRLAYLHTNMQ